MKDPAFLFYSQDFLTGTMFMNNEQIGIYIRLLCAQHQLGGIIEKDSFNQMIGSNEIIRSKFIKTEEGFYNLRLMNEMDKRSKKSSNLSANAKIRWEKEKQRLCKSNAIALKKDMPIESEDEDVIESKDAINLNTWSLNYFDEKFINKKSIETFDKLLRIDKYTTEQIKNVIKFAREDTFWSQNFLTPNKLRDKNKEGVKYIDVFLAKIKPIQVKSTFTPSPR
jgi:uncharacterized protein YdaU (DUF1376 family)